MTDDGQDPEANAHAVAVHSITKADPGVERKRPGGSAGLLSALTATLAFGAGAFGSRSGPTYNPFPSLGQRSKQRPGTSATSGASNKRAKISGGYGGGGTKLARMAAEGRALGGKGPGSNGH